MRILILALTILFSSMLAAAEENTSELGKDLVNPGYMEKPAWFKESFLDLAEDVAEATDAGKRIMLYFHQDGCPYCTKLLQDNFADREIATMSQKHFETIAINIWGDRSVVDLQGEETTEKQFAANLRVQYTPTLLFLDEQGKVVSRINGYFPPHKFKLVLDYVAGKMEKQIPVGEFLASSKPAAASGKLHQEKAFYPSPLMLADQRQDSYRPLLVFFEQHQCSSCDELHQDGLRRPEVAASLSNFDMALVDLRSREKLQTPDGRMLSAAAWARELGIQYAPSMVFFDSKGKEVFRVEAYLKSFHLLSVLDYVSTGAYLHQPNFQRFIQHRADTMHDLNIAVDLMQ